MASADYYVRLELCSLGDVALLIEDENIYTTMHNIGNKVFGIELLFTGRSGTIKLNSAVRNVPAGKEGCESSDRNA